MTIVLTGGGSGGHITPILAVAHELKRLRPDVQIVYIGQKGDRLGDLPKQSPDIDLVYSVRAGKFRRYHNEGPRQLLDIKTMVKNIRDVGFVVVGFFQSWLLLRRIHPDSLFIKGGFVGVPVGLAAAMHKIPFITHDSDAMPGLANRIIGRWAAVHAVALPQEVYKYPPQKTVTVGVPIHANYQPVTPEIQVKFRREIGLGEYNQVVLITGGGLGARRLNTAAAAIVPGLLKDYTRLAIVHTVGRGNEAVMHQTYEQELSPADLKRVTIEGYLTDLYKYSAASDVIIARAGATNLAEFAVQGKACVIVPNPLLTGGHQLKNAAYLAEHQAIEIVTEQDTLRHNGKLDTVVRNILDSQSLRGTLSQNLSTFAQPNAAARLAELLLKQMPQKASS
jgi:UDP-N-acetylglucosamine--N-acetylmuramyl-(pentapeptide) pyrophosphoryl-undecaprenol N-acetylglucosamine transferase